MLLKWIPDNLGGNQVYNNNNNSGLVNQKISKQSHKEKMIKQIKENNKHSIQQFLNNGSDVIKVNSVFTVVPEEVVVNRRGTYDFKVYFH